MPCHGRPQNPSPRAARDGVGRAVPGKRLGLLVARLTNGDGDGELADPHFMASLALSRARPVSGLPVPLGEPAIVAVGFGRPHGP